MNPSIQCWCGNRKLTPFTPSYLRCEDCSTLVSSILASAFSSGALRAESHYDHDYWFSHQTEDLHLPDIIQRSRLDLPERCLYWLRTLLRHKVPPARVLELGSGHGGFLALLRWAGFEATGLEVDPWVVEFAQKTFAIPMLVGEVERKGLPPESLDVIILMDVLEHLASPLETVRHCLSLLRPEGLLVVQTPKYPGGKTHEDLVAEGSPFLKMLMEKEHSFLFSESAVRKLLGQSGAPYLQFEPPIFPYDMFLLASRGPIQEIPPEQEETCLAASPEQRMVQALLDLDQERTGILERYSVAEADRAARLEQVNRLTQLLREAEADRTARLEQINQLTQLLRESEADRAARLDQIKKLTALIRRSEKGD